jgi:hypothetical protein
MSKRSLACLIVQCLRTIVGLKSTAITGLWSRKINRKVKGQQTFETETVLETDMNDSDRAWLRGQISSGKPVEFVHEEQRVGADGEKITVSRTLKASFKELPKMIEFVEVKVDNKTMEKLPLVKEGDYLQVWPSDYRQNDNAPTHSLRVRTQVN